MKFVNSCTGEEVDVPAFKIPWDEGGTIPPGTTGIVTYLLDRGWWQCKTCGVVFEDFTCPPTGHICSKAYNPLTGKGDNLANVLSMLASQENCDGEPYDQMQAASAYIRVLERQVDVLFKLSRLVRNTDGLFPSSWGREAGQLLIQVKALDEERYQKEVVE